MTLYRPETKAQMADQRRWVYDAECQDHPPGLFDTMTVTRKAGDGKVRVTLIPDEETEENIKLAREICTTCPVMMQCLRHAVRFNVDHGVWGGMLVEEREAWAATASCRAAI